MTGLQLAGGIVLALAAGAGVGWLARSEPGRRPPAVEAALVAHEKRDAEALRRALADAGPADAQPSPWREELRFLRAASASDWDALRRLGREGPEVAGTARALLLVSESDPDPEERRRAEEALKQRFPRSWVHARAARGAR